MAAALGLDATGVDAAAIAIDLAKTKARSRGLEARFLVVDVLDLPSLDERFDTVLDCGCFHTMDDEERRGYLESLKAVIPPGGRFFMLAFSDRQPGNFGPRRLTRGEIEDAFADGWHVDAIDPTVLVVNLEERSAKAWLSSITRTE